MVPPLKALSAVAVCKKYKISEEFLKLYQELASRQSLGNPEVDTRRSALLADVLGTTFEHK